MEEKIIFSTAYDKEEIQSFAEANYDRELTDIELNRMSDYIWDDDNVSWARMELMARAIEAVKNTKDNQWKLVDDDYLAKQSNNEQNITKTS